MQEDDSKKGSDKVRNVDQLKELLDKEEYTLRKRLPRKLPKRKNDVYVTRKTDFKGQLERCQKLLDAGNEVFVHGLGAAINRAVNLALQLKTRGLGTIEISTHTSTVELVDDLEPEGDELEHDIFTRNNSAIHIRVFRPETLILDMEGTSEAMQSKVPKVSSTQDFVKVSNTKDLNPTSEKK